MIGIDPIKPQENFQAAAVVDDIEKESVPYACADDSFSRPRGPRADSYRDGQVGKATKHVHQTATAFAREGSSANFARNEIGRTFLYRGFDAPYETP